MPAATAKRKRLSTAVITLQHPLDHFLKLFLCAMGTAGLKPRTLKDHKSHYRYLQHWLTEQFPTLKLDEMTADHIHYLCLQVHRYP